MAEPKKALCLTGWQQEREALAGIVPADAQHFDYAAYSDAETLFAALPREPDVAIGWSLGGQLLARAVSNGYIRPGLLILLAAPFQFIDEGTGSSIEQFNTIREHYVSHPSQMLAQFQALVALGDNRQSQIARSLLRTKTLWENGLYWLDELARGSCKDMHFRRFPHTVIVYGENDKVIPPAQAALFAQHLPGAEMIMLPGCGHAPHLHDSVFLKDLIDSRV
ncbi:MAG TPA: alpha/beta fold hydrolase [Rickettsiales bacterium]|nr:alpha/beta fold hydrolase [Rickettsiales bacterium]